METGNIYSLILDELEREAAPLYTAEYYREIRKAEQHLEWLSAHLDEEGNTHLEQLWDLEIHAAFIERNALARAAIALGIRLALPG